VIESSGGLGLPEQTLFGAVVGGYFRGEKFNRDFPSKVHVLSQIDLAHTAAPHLFQDAVVRDGLSDHCCESYVCKTGKSTKPVELRQLRREILGEQSAMAAYEHSSVTFKAKSRGKMGAEAADAV
jgi:hypothetical protein